MIAVASIVAAARRLGSASVGAALCACFALLPLTASAQTTVKLSGTAYVDYYYTLTGPDGADLEGENGFTFRRLYLTSDFKLSEAFSARARLEAGDGNVGSKGAEPFVKDLYLRWKVAPEHALTIGITSPPVFDVSEKVWGYRSLEKTLMDFTGVVSSRDMGVRAEGAIVPGGALGYAAMFANNNGTKPEDDRYKRVYGQLRAFPTEALSFTAGLDYTAYEAPLHNGLTFNGFAGYEAEAFRFGVEAFANRITSEDDADFDRRGVSLFGAVQPAAAWEVVARYDHVWIDPDGSDEQVNLLIVGLAYQPHEKVRFIPNLHTVWTDADQSAEVNARITLELDL